MNARPLIDSLDFAWNGRVINGEVPIAKLLRLADMLENPLGLLSYSVTGGVDGMKNPFLDVHIKGMCRVLCQRCLESMSFPIQIDSRLLLCNQGVLDATDEEDEFDSILAESDLDVLNLLEEEVILGLPIAPKHASEDCRMTDALMQLEAGSHPFAGLAALKVD